MSEYSLNGASTEITFASALNDLRMALEAVAYRVRGKQLPDESYPPRTSSRANKKDPEHDTFALPDGTSINTAQLMQELASIVRDIADAPSAAPAKKTPRKVKAQVEGGGCDSPPLAGNQDGDVAFGIIPDPVDGGVARFEQQTFGGSGIVPHTTIREDGSYPGHHQGGQYHVNKQISYPGQQVNMNNQTGYPGPPQQGGYAYYIPNNHPGGDSSPPQHGGTDRIVLLPKNGVAGGPSTYLHVAPDPPVSTHRIVTLP